METLLRYFLFQSSSSKLRMSCEKNAEKRRFSKLNCAAPVSRIHVLKIANERSWSCTPMYNYYLRPSEMPSRWYGSFKTVTKKAKILFTNFGMETVRSPYFTLSWHHLLMTNCGTTKSSNCFLKLH